MSHRTSICRILLDHGPAVDTTWLAQKLGVEKPALGNDFLTLQSAGAIRREAGAVKIRDRDLVQDIAGAAPAPKAPMAGLADRRGGKRVRATFAVGEIEDGVDVWPSRTARDAACSRFPFAKMTKVGHSFAVEVPPGKKPIYVAAAVRAAATRYRQRNDAAFEFVIRVAPDAKTVRCWRVAPAKREKKVA